MRSLKRDDAIHLEAAEGWLDLGNFMEADQELKQISKPSRAHPDVMATQWEVHAAMKKWDVCLEIAETSTDLSPRCAGAWVRLALSLQNLDQTEEALETLLEVVEEFSENPTFLYYLAHFSCMLGELDEAKKWLEEACTLGYKQKVKALGLADEVMKPLWGTIRKF